MGQTTFANTRGVVHKGCGGLSTVFPDVCKTQVGSAVVPIPYPNTGVASDTTAGPSSVTFEGEMPMVKGSKYSKSSGDEPGSIGGVVSGVNKSECEFMLYSFDVMVEGKNLCRLGDPLFHNKKNIMG